MIGRNGGAFNDCLRTNFINRTDQIGLTLRRQPLNSQQYNRRLSCAGERQMNVEIVVQRDTRTAVTAREIENLGIFSPLQPSLAGVERIPTRLPKQSRRARSQALVQ